MKNAFEMYLDSREGDSRGGVGADHQRHDGGAQSAKHVGELKGQKRRETINKSVITQIKHVQQYETD